VLVVSEWVSLAIVKVLIACMFICAITFIIITCNCYYLFIYIRASKEGSCVFDNCSSYLLDECLQHDNEGVNKYGKIVRIIFINISICKFINTSYIFLYLFFYFFFLIV
jgi:hypothetical protein